MLESSDKLNKFPEIENSIWKQTNQGKWILTYNSNRTATDETSKPSLDFSVKRPLSIGSLVMTPKGIGRLLKLDELIARVKFLKNDEEENFERNSVSNEFNVYIKILNTESSAWYRITLPSNGTTDLIKKATEDLNMVDLDSFNFVLIYQGKELPDNAFFDSLDFRPESKILMSGCKMFPFKISKYTTVYTYWYISNVDGMTFSVNKKIKLAGVGMYGSHESKTFSGTLRIVEGGSSITGNVIYEEPAELPAAPSQDQCITTIMFKKPVRIKPSIDYTIEFAASTVGYVYYGCGGKNSMDGEKGVLFEFKYLSGATYSTGSESGLFPELYYLV